MDGAGCFCYLVESFRVTKTVDDSSEYIKTLTPLFILRVNLYHCHAVLGSLQESGGLDSGLASSSTSIRRQVDEDLAWETPYGHVLKEIDLPLAAGGSFKWSIVCPSPCSAG